MVVTRSGWKYFENNREFFFFPFSTGDVTRKISVREALLVFGPLLSRFHVASKNTNTILFSFRLLTFGACVRPHVIPSVRPFPTRGSVRRPCSRARAFILTFRGMLATHDTRNDAPIVPSSWPIRVHRNSFFSFFFFHTIFNLRRCLLVHVCAAVVFAGGRRTLVVE